MINNIEDLKRKSGIRLYASLFGKSVIAADSEEYASIQEATRFLLSEGWGVIHGGYEGGAMSAINDAASVTIKELGLSTYAHIAVPQKDHDANWKRVNDAQFTNVADDIFDRLRMITTSDVAIVLPKGGVGTQLEWTTVFHENQIKEYLGRPVQPLIFLGTPEGTDWKAIVSNTLRHLDLKEQSSGTGWVHFVDTLTELKALLSDLKNRL